MSRSQDSWPSLGRTLADVLASEPPAWVRPTTVTALRKALGALRADALRAVADTDTRSAPTLLGYARSAYMRARAVGGWLSETGD